MTDLLAAADLEEKKVLRLFSGERRTRDRRKTILRTKDCLMKDGEHPDGLHLVRIRRKPLPLATFARRHFFRK